MAKKAPMWKRIHPHIIRQIFATTLLDNGNDLTTVQALMGHSHIQTTESYLHSTDDLKVEAIRSLQFAVWPRLKLLLPKNPKLVYIENRN
jgi:site-specific recombinase XerD